MLFEERRFILFAIIIAVILLLVVWLLNLADIRSIGNTGWILLLSFFTIGLVSLHFAETIFNLRDLTHVAEINVISAFAAIVIINLNYSLSAVSIPTLLFINFITPSITYLAIKMLIRG